MSGAPHPRLYWTADRRALVEEGDPRGALLAYPPDDPVPPEHERLVAHRIPEAAPKADPGPVAKPAPAKARKAKGS